MLSNLAKIARENPADLKTMLDAMSVKQSDILIPETILAESSGNHWMTPTHYENLYKDLFEILSSYTGIFIISFDKMFALLKDGATNQSEAFSQFQLVAAQLNKANINIHLAIKAATSAQQLKAALLKVPKDAGERMAHLLVCTLLLNGMQGVTFFSDEEQGVFNIRKLVSEDETLLEIMRMPSQNVFLQCYGLQSYDCILYQTLRKNSHWTKAEMQAFIDRTRTGSQKNRHVRYLLTSTESDKTVLSNNEFTTMIHNNASAVVSF